ncbi:15338_t:CDS:1 [Funneliformis geosporum]|uniref:17352_t:CDS:1 n=1 Tax=Funneliformis geosporum TaxID=1117311 RepID=A0A9W4SJI5_9GLOM|nr:15338_t:CDS:1 [Funneliformis geosporum]CAI2169281.1 17352_t:CDS:1 [Funneliformis geosporum]
MEKKRQVVGGEKTTAISPTSIEGKPEGEEPPQIPKDVPKEQFPEAQNGNPTATITETNTITTTAITTSIVNDAVINTSDNSNTSSAGSTNILLAALLGTVGLIIILSGLLIIIIWLRRGEKAKGGIENRGLTQLNDDGNINVSMNDMNTYRPRDLDDEQLPSYAEAVVRGRSSGIITLN